jgi:hypothetical protein
MRNEKDKKNNCRKMRGLYIVLPSSRKELERVKVVKEKLSHES